MANVYLHAKAVRIMLLAMLIVIHRAIHVIMLYLIHVSPAKTHFICIIIFAWILVQQILTLQDLSVFSVINFVKLATVQVTKIV